jgi:BON domain-containing protein
VVARRALVLTLLVLLSSGGCALAGRSLGGYVDDKLVERGVKRRLSSEGPGGKGVKVDTFGGTVYLSGMVDTDQEKSDAEIVAWQVGGVQQVVNDIVVARLPAAVAALPDFRLPHPLTEQLPGVERVEPGRGGGPDLAYDHSGRVVASVYTIAWRVLIDSGLTMLPSTGRPIDHVSTYALPESADLPGPTYAIVIWHVSARDAAVPR